MASTVEGLFYIKHDTDSLEAHTVELMQMAMERMRREGVPNYAMLAFGNGVVSAHWSTEHRVNAS